MSHGEVWLGEWDEGECMMHSEESRADARREIRDMYEASHRSAITETGASLSTRADDVLRKLRNIRANASDDPIQVIGCAVITGGGRANAGHFSRFPQTPIAVTDR